MLKIYSYFIALLVLVAFTFGFAGPTLISSQNDLLVLLGFALVIATLPAAYWINVKIQQQYNSLNKNEGENENEIKS